MIDNTTKSIEIRNDPSHWSINGKGNLRLKSGQHVVKLSRTNSVGGFQTEAQEEGLCVPFINLFRAAEQQQKVLNDVFKKANDSLLERV